ncbi:hypothetical protein ACJRO7_010687 [Eucalyptus globulus]|uniref:Polygalacturonase n=1 Tax=Eucalyptus globulus TaxID=34317 RepID=A0ABD3LCQ0_EUCGL
MTAISRGAALIICLAVVISSCEARGGVNPLVSRARGAIRGVVDSKEKIFNVLQFGAKPDGRHESAMQFQRTWKAVCQWPGKAKMVIPQGRFLVGPLVFTGPCVNKEPIVVQIRGTLLSASPDELEDAPMDVDTWIQFYELNGLIVIGGGTLDGQGAAFWSHDLGGQGPGLPVNLMFQKVNNALVRKLSSVNPKGFHISVVQCNNIRLYNLRITAPADSPNTDGIHISRSNLVKIARSEIATGDDCIGMIQGSTAISIKNVKCGPGHGISIGSLGKYENEADVRGVVVKNCTFSNTDNGLRIKTMRGPKATASRASSIIFQDIIMRDVKNPIIIDQEYNAHGKNQANPSPVKISDVHFINVRGTSTSPVAVQVACSRIVPCQNLQFYNINLDYVGKPRKALPPTCTSTCTFATGLSYGGIQKPPACH